MTDNELRAMMADLISAQARTDAQLAKTDAQLAKTDAQLAKTDAKLDRLAEIYDRQIAEARARHDKTDAQLAATDAQLAKTDAKLDRLAEMYGGVGNNQGRVAEEFYYNSLKHDPVLNGIRYDVIDKNVTRTKAGIEEEYDLLLINGQDVMIVEVKYRLHPKDIVRLLNRKLGNFLKLFPQYRSYRLHPVLATSSADDDVRRMALERGILVLQRRGHVIETLAA